MYVSFRKRHNSAVKKAAERVGGIKFTPGCSIEGPLERIRILAGCFGPGVISVELHYAIAKEVERLATEAQRDKTVQLSFLLP